MTNVTPVARATSTSTSSSTRSVMTEEPERYAVRSWFLVSSPVGSDRDQAVIEQAIERGDVAGELSGVEGAFCGQQVCLGSGGHLAILAPSADSAKEPVSRRCDAPMMDSAGTLAPAAGCNRSEPDGDKHCRRHSFQEPATELCDADPAHRPDRGACVLARKRFGASPTCR